MMWRQIIKVDAAKSILSLLFYLCLLMYTSVYGTTDNSVVVLRVSLQPNYVFVHENQMAVFNCYYSCDVMERHSHTVYWHIGDVLKSRGFSSRRARKFTRKTGLYVEVEDLSTCTNKYNGTVWHQLRINATSSARWNKTAIQCVALRSHPAQIDFYSIYGLLFVNPKVKPPEVKSPTMIPPENRSPTVKPLKDKSNNGTDDYSNPNVHGVEASQTQ